jgi:serine phosphatase RsbU (regulator of sigma subunit)
MSTASGRRTFAVASLFFVAALIVSWVLYQRAQEADLNHHAQVIQAFGEARHADELLSKQVLAARFGLLNQYDPINATQAELARATEEVSSRIEGPGGSDDPELENTCKRLEDTVAQQGQTVERFKAENSVLRNSVYYLPTAARELEELFERDAALPAVRRFDVTATRRVSQAALVYSLVGDESARKAYTLALADLDGRVGDLDARVAALPPEESSRFRSFLAHARVIRDKQPVVDGWVKRVMGSGIGDRLDDVELVYQAGFNTTVAASNASRKVLYGWSVFLVVLVGFASIQLRRLYVDLERRVAERTADLAKALDALWGEMKLARRIQEALVPISPTLANCDVAAAMKPAEQVGGDYYDVVVSGAWEWILVGDVSGHGVPAGLVMMMCHTAVRTALHGNPEIRPEELLAQVNTVLTQNIRLLDEDKFMTISAFRRGPDGTITFAGAHTDVMVYRAEANNVETFETEGIWLGIKENIADSLRTKSFELRTGDVLVLHTDGITEATRDGALFDVAGLRAVVSLSRGKTSKEIVDDTFRAIDGFKISDDATLLVVRQLDRAAAGSA